MKKTLKGLRVLLTLALVVSLMVPAAMATGLSDIGNSPAKKYIEQGVAAGYISGYPDGTFRPNNTVTRGAFCKILNQALGLEATTTISFSDVKSGDTFYKEIQKAVYAGYISGYNDNTFRASTTITRQQAAVMLSRIVTNPATLKALSTLKDASSVASYGQTAVRMMISKGYLTADSNGKFNPNGAMTRAQTATSIALLRAGEKIVHGSVDYTTANKTYSNNIYVGPLTVTVPASGTLTYSNCKLLGLLTVKSGCTVDLPNTNVVAMSVNADKTAKVTVSGSGSVTNSYLTSPASLTEKNLTGSGFVNVSMSGASLKNKTSTLSGNFDLVSTANPTAIALTSGKITALNIKSGATGTTTALGAGTTVAKATLDGVCAFTGTGAITEAVQNVAGVTYQTAPGKVSGTAASTVKPQTGALVPTVTPTSGTTGVSTSPTIILQFTSELLNASGYALSPGEISNGIVELRAGSATGTTVPITAAVSSDWKSIAIRPISALQGSTIYYVILQAGGLKNASGETCARQVSTFTTVAAATGMTPVALPASGSTGIPVTVQPTLTFAEDLYAAAYTGLQSASLVISGAVQLYQSSISAGNQVAAAVSLNGRMVTVVPTVSLVPGYTYILVLNGGYLKNATGTTNTYQTFTFTTASGSMGTMMPSASPANGATNVSVSVHPALTFYEDLYAGSYTGFTSAESSLRNGVKICQGTSKNGPTFPGTLSYSGRTVTFTPDGDFLPNTTYTIFLEAGIVKNASGLLNTAQSYSFTTGSASTASSFLVPTANPANGATGVLPSVMPELMFSEDVYAASYSGLQSASVVVANAVHLYKGTVSSGSAVAANVSISGRTVTLAPSATLDANTTYTLVLSAGYLKNALGTTNSYQAFTFTTAAGNYGGTLVPTVNPTSGTTGVSQSIHPTLTFNEEIYAASYAGFQSASSVVGGAVQLYQGYPSSGSSVSMSVSLSGRTITMTPSGTLSPNTLYTIVLNAGYLKNATGLANTYQTFTFTTAGSGSSATGTLSRFEVQVNNTATAYLSPAKTTACNTVYLSSGSSLIFTAVASSDTVPVTVAVSGIGLGNPGTSSITIRPTVSTTLTVTVTVGNGVGAATYTMTVPVVVS
ncbi:MAG: Ig-like domain-containing protein [Oscillibacter sp.]|jgi:hypothetical protein|nr:Ig-like domain-containing protein [Oscillibacter sp.]